MTSFDETAFLYGANDAFIEQLYQRWLDSPGSVDPSWAQWFEGLAEDESAVRREAQGASWAPRASRVIGDGDIPVPDDGAYPQIATPQPFAGAIAGGAPIVAPLGLGAEQIKRATQDSIRALMLIRAYRARGHLEAHLDPLGLEERAEHSELDPGHYGFTENDLDRPIYIGYVLGMENATLREIITALKRTYCGSIGVEFLHIQDPDQKAWLQERIEGGRNHTDFTENGKKAILERLTAAESFEKFLDKKFTGTKRFGLDGGEALMPALEQIVKRGGQLGLREIVIGMAHRGRLNMLTNFMGKPFTAVFSEFQGGSANPDDVQGSGDVKYHLGTSSDRSFDGVSVHLSLTANPSHLEIVNPVVLGRVRAKQRQMDDEDRTQVMGLLLHGDAAFSGQGVVAECFDMSQLRGYRTGGTIHVIINNQIGFTTAPRYSRSSPYSSDVAKMVDAPILHVNGDDPEAVVHCARIATEFRQKFKRDVVLDLICYRRFGHNEGDEPMFTQPLMYKAIKKHTTTRTLYARQLEQEGVLAAGESEKMQQERDAELEAAFEAAKTYKPNKADWLEGKWTGLGAAGQEDKRRAGDTSCEWTVLQEVGAALTTAPPNFNIHSKIKRQLEAKKQMFESGEGIDWATAEALAFGTLLVESTPVRLSGQDSGRGTFSHRHSVFVDQETEERYVPLNHIRFGQAPYEVIDSPLSEAGVLGFEYGYSWAEPNTLTLWEGQFGDFANGAQVVVDQFISSAESKWLRMSGLVMLLPHGFEGQGPEHSSARLERYLQLCAEDNMQVCSATTPAQYFHMLRRQVRRGFRKPLIVMSPKSLLRHKRCISKLSELATGSEFHRVLWDDAQPCADDKAKRVVLCSGKVYYDLFEERERRGINDVVLLRLEQIYPFPADALQTELGRFPKAEFIWCQEEPRNMGSWLFVEHRLENVLKAFGAKHNRARYAGRPGAASPATGLAKRHAQEQKDLIEAALVG